MLMLGREIPLPIDLIFRRPDVRSIHEESDYAFSLRQKIELVSRRARENLQTNAAKQNKYYDRRVYGKQFEVGDLSGISTQKGRKD